MEANRTTMSLEEAAEKRDMQELLEYIQKQVGNLMFTYTVGIFNLFDYISPPHK